MRDELGRTTTTTTTYEAIVQNSAALRSVRTIGRSSVARGVRLFH